MNGAYRAAVDSPARFRKWVIKGRQQGVLPPPMIIKQPANGLLVQAHYRLPVEEQEMLYLSFYRRISQEKIGKLYGRSRSATGRRIRKSIQRLYEEMGYGA